MINVLVQRVKNGSVELLASIDFPQVPGKGDLIMFDVDNVWMVERIAYTAKVESTIAGIKACRVSVVIAWVKPA
jgi:hypothetical protein